MKKRVYRRSESQIINNFYTLVTIVIMAVVITLYTKYINPNKEKTPIALVLPCQKELLIEQKIANFEALKEAGQLLNEGSYLISGGIILDDDSSKKEPIDTENINAIFSNTIQAVEIRNAEKFLTIKYEIIEKDITTTNLFFVVSFRVSANEVFKSYTVVEYPQMEHLSQKVECIMNSFKHNAKQ